MPTDPPERRPNNLIYHLEWGLRGNKGEQIFPALQTAKAKAKAKAKARAKAKASSSSHGSSSSGGDPDLEEALFGAVSDTD